MHGRGAHTGGCTYVHVTYVHAHVVRMCCPGRRQSTQLTAWHMYVSLYLLRSWSQYIPAKGSHSDGRPRWSWGSLHHMYVCIYHLTLDIYLHLYIHMHMPRSAPICLTRRMACTGALALSTPRPPPTSRTHRWRTIAGPTTAKGSAPRPPHPPSRLLSGPRTGRRSGGTWWPHAWQVSR